MTATGTSPSFSITPGSSPSSDSSRFAQARPAVPPPTMATPTSISSSSGSSPRLTNSPTESTGGGNSLGACGPWPLRDAMALGLLLGLDGVGQLGEDLVEVADHAEVGELEDGRVGVLVDGHDVL